MAWLNHSSSCLFGNHSTAGRLKTEFFEANICKCDLIYTTRQKKPSSSDYYSAEMMSNYNDYYKKFRKKVYSRVVKNLPKRKMKLLDIGCSYGWFMEVCKDNGINGVGIEPSGRVCEQSTGNVVCSTAEKFLVNNKKKYSLVSMWNVLEHIEKPAGALESISRIQKKGDSLIIAVPNLAGLVNSLLIKIHTMTFGLISSHLDMMFQSKSHSMHLYYFSLKHLKKLLQINGYKVRKVLYEDIMDRKNLWIRFRMESMPLPRKVISVVSLKILLALSALTGRKDELIVIAVKT